jgi:hypothetical protein
MHPGAQGGLSTAEHKPHDEEEENVHLLRQEQLFLGYYYLWRWEPWQG